MSTEEPLYRVAAKRNGRPIKYDDPAVVLRMAHEYFSWVDRNPIWEVKPFAYQGDVELVQVPKQRVRTLEGLRLYMGIQRTVWDGWRRDPKFSSVVQDVEDSIRDQKFTGAASDVFNASIIARDLGLVDKQERDHRSSDGSMTPTRITRTIVRPGDPQVE